MKKSLCLMLVLLFIGSFLIPTVGNASDASELTAQQKYDALAAKGIFNGINGEAGLDQNMNRAQFARVAALILGLEGIGTPDTKVVDEKPFSDVELGTWYVEEIAAAKEAGLMIGNGNGTFNPSGDISVQELAVTTARLLNLEPVEDSNVEGLETLSFAIHLNNLTYMGIIIDDHDFVRVHHTVTFLLLKYKEAIATS